MKKLLFVAILGFSGLAMAEKALVDFANGQGYGMAGCGLGSVVFGDKPGIVQIFATTTNGVSGNQTFGISTGSLNCGESGKIVKASQFIDVNKTALMADITRGQGETVATLGQLIECKNSNFPATMKKNYQTAFPSGSPTNEQISALAYKSCEI